MIRATHHTAISTPDLERLVGFYRDVLGFKVLFDLGWPAGSELSDKITGLEGSAARFAMLEAGAARLEIFQFESPAPKPSGPDRPVCDHGFTHVGFTVDDVDAAYEQFKAAGMTFHCPPQDLGEGRVTYGRDPDGNVVEIMKDLGS